MADKAQAMIQGALVADAATMGLHWIYDQDHIAKIAPDEPAFVAPDAAHYVDVMGYFAHGARRLGQNSQYGEQLKVMQDALAASDGTFDPQGFVTAFQAHFGYGGGYVGYIDHATRDSLDKYRRAAEAALDKGRAVAWDGPAGVTTAMATKALALTQQFTGDTLRTKFEEAVRITHDDDATLAYGFAVLDAVREMPAVTGAVDVQLPAIAKLPPLVVALAQADEPVFTRTVTTAVRLTSDHQTSVDFGLACARMMRAALTCDDMAVIVDAGLDTAPEQVKNLIAEALSMQTQDVNAVTGHFGLACDLSYGVPSAVHNVLTASSYAQAVRRNIYAGGDNCGRSILVGALMGAVHGIGGDTGIPQDWIDQLA